jgi:hypothetical protein
VNLEGLHEQMGWLAIVTPAAALVAVLRPDRLDWWRRFRPVVIYFVLLFGLHTLVTTFTAGSGFLNSTPALVPAFLLIVVDSVWRTIPRAPVALLALGLLGAHFTLRGLDDTRRAVEARNAMAQPLASVRTLIADDARSRQLEIVVMTRVPWELNWSTGFKAIQIPNDDLPTIVDVARRYRANYLLLPAPRPALDALYRDERADARFAFVGAAPHASPALGRYSPLKVFRIVVPSEMATR